MARQQDIHLVDEGLHKGIQQAWSDESYVSAIGMVQQNQLSTKRLTQEIFNSIYTMLTTLQNNDDGTFKSDRIELVDVLPSGLVSGTVVFLKD